MFSIVAYWFVNHHFWTTQENKTKQNKTKKKAISIKFKITTTNDHTCGENFELQLFHNLEVFFCSME
jgi:hypothetical protein